MVTLAAFMEVVDTTIVNVSLPYIAGDLGVSTDNAAWTLTTYLVANGVTLTVSSSLSLHLGRRKYFLISIAGFTAASLACGLSTNFEELLLFRALQGLFGGGLQPMQQQIVLDTFPPAQRSQALSITAVATIIAPVVGPLLGGYLTFNYSWHWIFLVNVPVGLGTLFGVLAVVQDPPEAAERARTAPRFDWIGTALVVLALGCMELGADRGEDYDWLSSSFIQTMLALSVIGYVGGVTWLMYARNPMVNLRMFGGRNFALSWYSMAMMGFALYASAIIMPLFAQDQLGYNSVLAGWLLAPGAVVPCVLIPIVGKVLDVVPVKWVIAAGGIALAASLYYSMGLVPDLDFFHITLYRSAQTAALALLFVPLSASAYSTIPPEPKDDAASLFTMARNVYGGVGISIGTALVRDNLDLLQAVLRVLEARQGIVTARSAGLPGLNGSASYMRYQLGARGILESDGAYGQLNSLADRAQDAAGTAGLGTGLASGPGSGGVADALPGPVTQPINLYQGALSASWELDLFGRVRRSVEQARAQAQAQREAANDALTSLESEVAQAYVQLRGAQALRATQQINIRSARDSLALTQSRQTTGLSNALDVDQARTQLLTLERQLPEYDKQERDAAHRLDVLVGRPPGALEARLLAPAPLPHAVGVGMLSTLARRRPDVREAEAQLHAADAGVGVATAQFYPGASSAAPPVPGAPPPVPAALDAVAGG